MNQQLAHLAKIGYRRLQKVLNEKQRLSLDLLVGKQVRIHEPDEVEKLQLETFSGARVVEPNDLVKQIFKAYYGEMDENLIVPSADCHRIQGFVPFVRDRTGIFVYNFHERNYGMKDPILYRIYLVAEGKVVAVQNKILKGDEIFFFLDPVESIFSPKHRIPENGAVIVQAFHPRLIKHARGEHRFYGIYKNNKCEYQACTHSLLVERSSTACRNRMVGYRNYGVSTKLKYLTVFGRPTELLTASTVPTQSVQTNRYRLKPSELLNGTGFYVQLDGHNSIESVWHDDSGESGLSDNRRKQAPSPAFDDETFKTAFFVPDFEIHAPVVIVSNDQLGLGFVPPRITFSLFDRSNTLLARSEQTFEAGVDEKSLDFREMFKGHKIRGSIYCVADLHVRQKDMPDLPVTAQLMIYYRSDSRFSDEIHSQHTSHSRFTDLVPHLKSYRSAKFAPFIHHSEVRSVIAISNVGGARPNQDDSVTLRVISDLEKEVVVKVQVPPGGMGIITSDELVEKMDHQIKKSAVVQLEHKTTNYVAQIFILQNGSLATEHFTGN